MGPNAPNRAQPLVPWAVPQQALGLGTNAATPEPLAGSRALLAPPTFDLGKYGDVQTYPCNFAGARNELAILRPTKAVRTFLLVVNSFAVPNIIRVNFDAPASPTLGMPIPAGGNLFMDYFVPQQDVHVYSLIAGTIMCFYCHVNVADARRVFDALSG